MSKRQADHQLTNLNYHDEEDDSQPSSGIQLASSSEIAKRKIKPLRRGKLDSKPPTTSAEQILINETKPAHADSFKQSETNAKTLLAKIKALNNSFLDQIGLLYKRDSLVNFRPLCEDYCKYRSEIIKDLETAEKDLDPAGQELAMKSSFPSKPISFSSNSSAKPLDFAGNKAASDNSNNTIKKSDFSPFNAGNSSWINPAEPAKNSSNDPSKPESVKSTPFTPAKFEFGKAQTAPISKASDSSPFGTAKFEFGQSATGVVANATATSPFSAKIELGSNAKTNQASADKSPFSAPKFEFGSKSANDQVKPVTATFPPGNFGADSTSDKKSNELSNTKFNFGATPAAEKKPNDFSFTASPFDPSRLGPSTNNSSNSTFSFTSKPNGEVKTDNNAFVTSTNSTESKPNPFGTSFSFGQKVNSEKEKPLPNPFAIGQKADADKDASVSKQFAFGQSNDSTKMATASNQFSFGQNTDNNKNAPAGALFSFNQKTELSNGAPAPTSFSFGQPADAKKDADPPKPFTFGSGAGFSFGGNVAPLNNGFQFTPPEVKKVENEEEGDENEPKDSQIDLMSGAGEEGENNIFTVKAKVMTKKGDEWDSLGVGQLKLNIQKSDGVARLLLRAEGGGRVLVNSRIFKEMTLAKIDGKRYYMALSLDGAVKTCLVKVGKEQDMTKLVEEIEKIKKSMK